MEMFILYLSLYCISKKGFFLIENLWNTHSYFWLRVYQETQNKLHDFFPNLLKVKSHIKSSNCQNSRSMMKLQIIARKMEVCSTWGTSIKDVAPFSEVFDHPSSPRLLNRLCLKRNNHRFLSLILIKKLSVIFFVKKIQNLQIVIILEVC